MESARLLGAPAALVMFIPGAKLPDWQGILRKHRFSKVGFHVVNNEMPL